MNPDKEDPNNHVPAVMPEDDWDGLDVDQVFDSQLPPRRADASKIPKMDVNLSGYQSIEPATHVGSAAPTQDEAALKSSVLVHVNAERAIIEKEDFQPSLSMEDMKQDGEATQNHQKAMVQARQFREERNDWGGNLHKGSAKWMVYTALGVIAIIALTIFLKQMTGSKNVRKSNNEGLGRLKPIDTKIETSKELGEAGQLASSNKKAIEIYASYARAEKAEDVLDFIYLPDRNSAALLKAWKPIGAPEGWFPSAASTWKTYRYEDQVYAELRGVHHEYSKFNAVFRLENSSLKMDWRATVGYGTAGFDELKTGQGDGGEIRGWISLSDFFTQELSDDRYHSFIVRSPDKEASIWVYTEIGGEVDKDILELFMVSPITGEYLTEARVILDLERGEKKILPRQWMVKNLLSTNWLDREKP